MGVDTTDLVVTNGYRVWQRSIQIGGSHFTKALTKELKLTFGKAEHLKKNAAQAEDPKAVFQAMRPDLQRPGRGDPTVDRLLHEQQQVARRTLKEVVTLGNAMKLPGLQRYLAQNLDIPVKTIEEFDSLVGGSVTSTPAFEENRLSFPVAYGLCVQALGLSRISTNLLPGEIVTQRIIRAKKPWAAAAAAMLMLGMAANYASYVGAWQTVDVENEWKQSISQSKSMASTVGNYESTNSTLRTKFEQIAKIGERLQSNVDGRLLWLELLKAIDGALPRDERPAEERLRTAEDVTARNEVHITSMDCQQFPDLSAWFGPVKPLYEESQQTAAERRAAEAAAAGEDALEEEGVEDQAPDAVQPETSVADAADAQPDPGPTGDGWVIQLVGYHFHNDGKNEGEQFLRSTLIQSLEEGSIELPDGPGGEMIEVSFKDLGIGYPVVITKNKIESVQYDPEAEEGEQAGRPRRTAESGIGGRNSRGARGGQTADKGPEVWKLRRYDFVVQFTWTPTPRHVRQQNRETASAEDTFASN